MTENKILIAHYIEEIRQSFRDALLENNFELLPQGSLEILETREGQAALDIIKREGDNLKLIILNLLMPGINGTEILNRLQSEAELQKIPLVITAWSEAEIAQRVTHEERAYFAAIAASEESDTPFKGEEIVQAIESALIKAKNSPIRQAGHCLAVTSVAITPDSQTFLSGSGDNTIKYWDLSTGKLLQSIKINQDNFGKVTCLAITPDGKNIISGGEKGKIKLWKLSTGELLDNIKDGNLDIRTLAISPDSKTLLSGSTVFCAEGCVASISAWDLSTRRQIYNLGWELGEIDAKAIAITPDGTSFIAEQEKDCAIAVKLWDLKTGKLIREICKPSFWWFSTLAISPNGKTFAYSSSQSGVIQLFQLSNGELLHTFSGHTDMVDALAFSPDSKIIFSGSRDKTIKKWCIDTGELLHTFIGHSDMIFDMAISQDGKNLVSASKDCTVRTWQLS